MTVIKPEPKLVIVKHNDNLKKNDIMTPGSLVAALVVKQLFNF